MSMIKDQWVGRQKLAIEHPLMHQRIPFEKRITHRSMVDERTVERLDLLESQHWVAWPQGATIQSIVSQIGPNNSSPYVTKEERHIHVSTSVQQASCARQSIARLPCYFTVRLLASHLASR
ncbi:hypothetical protein KCV00_g318, partial [Aureobasidium melanogenum]